MKLEKHSLIQLHNYQRKNDIAYFANYYFPHYLKKKSSELHYYLYETFEKLKGGARISIAAPRGNAKSSISTTIVPLFMALNEKKKFIVLLSDSSTQANSFLASIREELENNERLRADYGDQVGDVWKFDDIVLSNGVKIQSLGAKKKVRGLRHKDQRPDLIIGDDLENDENVSNPDQRRKISDWWFKAVSKAGDETTDLIIVGTILHYDSLLATLLKNPTYKSRKFQAVKKFSQSDLWHKWEDLYSREKIEEAEQLFKDNREEMLRGTEVLWEDGQDYLKLMTTRLAEGPASFDSEYQNNPVNPEDCLFKEEWFKFYEPGEYTNIVGAVDPSLGKAKGDYSAIIFLGKHKDGYIDVLSARVERLYPDQTIKRIIDDAITIHKSYPQTRITAFGVETVAFQEFFKDQLISETRKNGVYLPVVETENQTTKKQVRIQSLQPHIKNGTIRFLPDQRLLLEQLKYYPLAAHDDAPDALEMALRKLLTPQLGSVSY